MFLQRHGECETNVKQIFTCRKLDPDLTEKGRLQIHEKIAFYKTRDIQRIVSSPSKRAVQTAEILGSALKIKYEIDDSLLEVDIGDLEGMSERDAKLLKLFFDILRGWISMDENTAFPGGESKSDIEKRLDHAIALLSPSTMLIGHAAFFALLLGKLKMPFENLMELFLPRGGTAHYFQDKRQWGFIQPSGPADTADSQGWKGSAD